MTTEQTVDGDIVAIDELDLSGRLRPADPAQVRLLETVLDQAPPVLVLVDGQQLRLLDGYMRVDAARALGRSTVRAELVAGDLAEAWECAIRTNASHGLPLSARQRRDAALRLLTLAPQWSDRRVASASGVDAKTVGRLRVDRASRPGEEMAHLGSDERVGRDGRRYPSPEELERRRDAARSMLEDKPELSDRAVAREVMLSPTTVRRLREQPSPARQPEQEPKQRVRRSAARLARRLPGAVVGAVVRTARLIASCTAALFDVLLGTARR